MNVENYSQNSISRICKICSLTISTRISIPKFNFQYVSNANRKLLPEFQISFQRFIKNAHWKLLPKFKITKFHFKDISKTHIRNCCQSSQFLNPISRIPKIKNENWSRCQEVILRLIWQIVYLRPFQIWLGNLKYTENKFWSMGEGLTKICSTVPPYQ